MHHLTYMKPLLTLALYLALAPVSFAAAASLSYSGLDAGYRQMYNLQFEQAHLTFARWEQDHPADPLGPASDAAAYLFAEFDRLGVLESEFFTDDDGFKKRRRQEPDPAARQAFRKAIERSQRLADSNLGRDPRDTNALFAKVLGLGLESDYLALIAKRNLASVSYMKSAGTLAESLLALDPTRYDAYLAIGVENYILGLSPAPVRWILHLYGAQTDKNEGLDKLRLTAEKGHYLQPFARLLLAVAALRDHNRNHARDLLRELAQEFPNNHLYNRELARLN